MSASDDSAKKKKPDFLVFSDDWGEHPSSCQHIFRHIAKDHRVLWVNTIGMRNPTLSWTDVRKVFVKVSKMFGRKRTPTAAEVDANVTVCQPLMLPGSRSRAVRAFNAHSVTRKVSAMTRSLGMADPIVVTTVPNASEYPELLKDRKVVYYCVDDFSLWPGFEADVVLQMESRLIERADYLIAASKNLSERISMAGKFSHLLTHGVDYEMFSTPATSELPALKGIPKPRVGFFGLIDGRMDWDLVTSVAKQMQNISFVFAGPVDASTSNIPQADNLYFIGPVSYALIPQFIAGLKVLLLPYRTGNLAEALSPLKLKEYLATQLPIISAPISEARALGDSLFISGTRAEWVNTLSGILRGEMRVKSHESSRQLLVGESWHSKAEAFRSLCVNSENISDA